MIDLVIGLALAIIRTVSQTPLHFLLGSAR